MTQRMIEITSPNFIKEEQLLSIESFSHVFGNDNPLALEIGCGIGDFIVPLAQQNSGINFLAIDIYNKGCYKTCRKVDDSKIQNVRVIRVEARYLLAKSIGREQLAAVYINCPDPWPKKRHRSRRLVNRDFLKDLLYYLQPGGKLYFSTDFADYAEDVAQLLPSIAGYRNGLSTPYALDLPEYPKSKYMRRFLEQGQPIHFIHYIKEENLTPAACAPLVIKPGFRSRWDKVGNE